MTRKSPRSKGTSDLVTRCNDLKVGGDKSLAAEHLVVAAKSMEDKVIRRPGLRSSSRSSNNPANSNGNGSSEPLANGKSSTPLNSVIGSKTPVMNLARKPSNQVAVSKSMMVLFSWQCQISAVSRFEMARKTGSLPRNTFCQQACFSFLLQSHFLVELFFSCPFVEFYF